MDPRKKVTTRKDLLVDIAQGLPRQEERKPGTNPSPAGQPSTAASQAQPGEPAPVDEDALADLAAMDTASFAAVMQEATSTLSYEAGDKVSGRIVRIDNENAYIDLGHKAEARISLEELEDTEKVPGALIEAMVLQEREDGLLLSRGLSRTAPELLQAAHETGLPVEGRVESRNTGGYMVNLAGTKAFCPISQIDRYPGRDLDAFIGQSFQFRITEIRDREVVVSRRVIQEEENQANRDRIWSTVKPGDCLEGVVTSVRDYGAFVDLGGVEGLIHKSEMGWENVGDPTTLLKRWDRLKVWVTEMDPKRQRIALTLKDPDDEPWRRVGELFVQDGEYEGVVVKVAEFGAFVELAPSFTGLVRVPNLSWERVEHPSQVVKQGDRVRVRVLEIDERRKRLDLGIRQTNPDPSSSLAEAYPVGGEVTGTVQEVSRKGLILSVDGNLEAWLPAREVELPPGILIHQRYRRGMQVTARIVEMDPRRRQLKLTQSSGSEAEEQEAMRQLKKQQKSSATSLGTLADLLAGIKVD